MGHRIGRTAMVSVAIMLAVAGCGPRRPVLAIAEFPPSLPSHFGDMPVNGGRTQAIAVDPRDSSTIVIATQFGGLWRTTGTRWTHLSAVSAVFAQDVAFSPEGRTLYATLARDNRTDNGGGIWISRDDGRTWARPPSAVPPPAPGVPARISAYGIAVDRYRRDRVYIATDFGVAISEDAGVTWRHRQLSFGGEGAISVLDLPHNVVLATSAQGVHRSTDGGLTWAIVRSGDFSAGFKAMDNAERVAYPFGRTPGFVSRLDTTASKLVLILQNVSTLFLYDDADQSFRMIPTPAGGSRGPFVRVSAAEDRTSIFVWVGAGVNLLRAKASRTRTSLAALRLSDWTVIGRADGLHDDTGDLGTDLARRPVLFGSDGGIFRPVNSDWSKWTNAGTGRSGWNSLQITDLAGTNTEALPDVHVNSLYFATQDNAIWASSDGGLTWPSSDCAEGFHLEVRKTAAAHSDVQVGYGKIGCGPSTFMFSDAHLQAQRAAPDRDSSGRSLSDLGNTYLVSPGRWIRTRSTASGRWEIWVSVDNGSTWRKRYNLGAGGIAPAGVFQFTEASQRGYIPVTGDAIDGQGRKRIGLMPIVNPLGAGVVTLGETSIRYLPDQGSLGVRATEFDWQAVFGLHRTDSGWIIAPDVNNGVVLVSRNGGRTWSTDRQLTDEVTKYGTLLLYAGDPYRMQVTHISFDPYSTNRILVGTREAGVIMSDDGGGRWWTVRQSGPMLYGTGFVFRRDDMAIASAYGRGLWVLNLRYRPRTVTTIEECIRCTVVEIGTGRKLPKIPDDLDSFIATGGAISGVRLRGRRLVAVSLSPGARWTRYLDVTADASEIEVNTKASPRSLRRLVPDLPESQVVIGLLLRDATPVAAILAPEPLMHPADSTPPVQDPPEDDRDSPDEPRRPYVTAKARLEVSGRAIAGPDDDVRILGGGFVPSAAVQILLDGKVAGEAAANGDGYVEWRLPSKSELAYGEHTIEAVQGQIRVQTRFVKAHVDHVERPQDKPRIR